MPRFLQVIPLCLVLLIFGGSLSRTAVPPKPATVGSSAPFEVVSIMRTDRIESYPRTIFWGETKESNGLIIVLKRKTPSAKSIYTTDFSLAFADDSLLDQIPRRGAIGISRGMKSPTETLQWNAGGAVSRELLEADQLYFGVLFDVPKKYHTFTLFYATPVAKELQESAAGTN